MTTPSTAMHKETWQTESDIGLVHFGAMYQANCLVQAYGETTFGANENEET